MTRLIVITEAIARRRSVKNVFLQISQNSQENNCARNFKTVNLTFFTLFISPNYHLSEWIT